MILYQYCINIAKTPNIDLYLRGGGGKGGGAINDNLKIPFCLGTKLLLPAPFPQLSIF